MEGIVYSSYSNRLHRNMEYKVYGTKGKICLALSAGGQYTEFETKGMVSAIAPFIESGKIQLVLVDGIDSDTWLATNSDPHNRMEMQQAWSEYVTDELLPPLRAENHDFHKPMVVGCNLGASNAAILFFRRPDIFDTCIGLSGIYSAQPYFGNYADELILSNSMDHYLLNIPMDHPWIRLYRGSRIILCSGRGPWEEKCLESTRMMDDILTRMDIPHWCDYWGNDVSHDWYWWRKQLAYFMGNIKL